MSMIIPDEYDKLFCRCDGSGASFVDSSTANPKTITANGNAIQIPTFFAGNRTAMFFDGASYVAIPDSPLFDIGTGDFTIEGFFFFSSLPSQPILVDIGGYSTGVRFGYYNNQMYAYIAGNSRAWNYVPALNQKLHLAIKRTGGNVYFYADGVQIGSGIADSGNISVSSGVRIGYDITNACNYFSGWMKELRISNVARTVAVPTQEYQNDANTVLLLHGDTTAQMPLGPAIFFSGTGTPPNVPYIQAPASNDYKVGTGDYTLEGFFNHTSIPAQPTYISMGGISTGVTLTYCSSSLYVYDAGTARTFSWTPVANKWYHICLVRTSGTLKAFIDGKQIGSDIASTKDIQTTLPFRVAYDASETVGYFIGSAREIRFSNVARYTSAFTPSQTGFTVDANTKLYIKGDENNGNNGTTVLSGGTASASNVLAGYPAADALDSNNGTMWHTDNSTPLPHWWKYDLGAGVAKTVNTISLMPRASDGNGQFIKDFSVKASNDNTNWTTLYTGQCVNNTTNFVFQDFGFSNTTAYRYYMVEISSNYRSGDNYASITEVKMFQGVVDSATTPKAVIMNGDAKIKYTEDYRSCIFKDETGKFPYPVGSAKVDFFAAFGNGAYYGTDAGNGYLVVSTSDDFKFGTGDFSAGIYFRSSAAFSTANCNLIDQSVYGGGGWGLQAISATSLNINLGGSSQDAWIAVTVPTMSVNTWYFVEMDRASGVTKTFLNGTQVDSRSDTYNYQPTRAVQIGGFYYTYNGEQNNQWTGLLDNIRISKGIARYTATFNPPEDYPDAITVAKLNFFALF